MLKSRVWILFDTKYEIQGIVGGEEKERLSRKRVTTTWVLQHLAGPFSSGLLCGGDPGVFLWKHHF